MTQLTQHRKCFEAFCKVLDDALNIRKTPGWGDEGILGVIADHGVYTIVEETMLGRLKSGAGWISLGQKYVREV